MVSVEGPECVDHEALFELIELLFLDAVLAVIVTRASVICGRIIDLPFEFCVGRD